MGSDLWQVLVHQFLWLPRLTLDYELPLRTVNCL